MNEMRKLMETIQQINEAGYGDEWCDDCGQGRDQCRCDDTGNPPEGYGEDYECPTCGDMTCTDDMCGVEVEEAFGDDPDPYSSERSAREATIALHELMDEGILDARAVADSCLTYMSEAEVADMAEREGFFGDE